MQTPDGRVLALDGKVTLDENAAYRHPHHEAFIDIEGTDPIELRAGELNLNYVKLDGFGGNHRQRRGARHEHPGRCLLRGGGVRRG